MKYHNGTIYLSGGMQFAKNLGGDWRDICSKELKKNGFFPLNITEMDVAYTKKHGQLFDYDPQLHPLQRKANLRKHFVYSDLEMIKNDADAVIVYYDESVRKGAGTISECQICFEHDIPLFLVSAFKDWKTEVPGWLYALTTKNFTDFDALHAYLKSLPPGILKKDQYNNRHSGDQYLCSLCGFPFVKHKQQFVSKISPLYCADCVERVAITTEEMYDRYEFFKEYIAENNLNE